MEKMIVEIFVVQGSKILLGFENILLLEQFHSIYVISADKNSQNFRVFASVWFKQWLLVGAWPHWQAPPFVVDDHRQPYLAPLFPPGSSPTRPHVILAAELPNRCICTKLRHLF